MKNLLFITAHYPSFSVPQAGQKITQNILEGYAKHYNIYLVAFYNEAEEKFINEDNAGLCKYIYLSRISSFRRIVSIISHIVLPIKASVRASSKVKKILQELQREVKFDLAHFEFTSAAYYMKWIKNDVKKVITEHDVTYQALERKTKQASKLARVFYNLEYIRQKKWELNVLKKVDEIIVLNEKDKLLLVNDGIPPHKIKIILPDINPVFKNIQRNCIEKYSILFWGAMNRKENIDGIEWFINKIFPIVLQQCSESKLYIVGAHPSVKIKKLESKNIIVTGFVENPAPYFEKCQIAIAPLRIGAGIKIKVLEYLEAGMPVITTSVGAEGISRGNLFLADNKDDFANMILYQFAS
ncbi:MAG: glycosyltransferase [Nitrospirae bacterium]|nr:glycosyltransferase [Nitrospirota bacterium]